jgi:hypothetical protein
VPILFVEQGGLEAARIGEQQLCRTMVEWLFDREWLRHI